MKKFRPLLIGVGVVAALLALLVVLAFLPPVQTWVARRVVASQPDLDADIGRIAVGLGSVEARNVVVRQPGLRLTLPSLEMELPLLAAAREHVRISRLVAHGWTLDLTVAEQTARAPVASAERVRAPAASAERVRAHAGLLPGLMLAQANPPAPAAAVRPTGAAVFDGIFAHLQLPVDLELDGVELSGTIIFPTAPGEAPGRAQVTLQGGNLRAGQEGEFRYTAEVRLEDPAAPIERVEAQGWVRARLATPRRFERLEVENVARATGGQFPQGATLRVGATATSRERAEDYGLRVATAEKTLVQLDAALPPDAPRLEGRWRVTMSDPDVAPFVLGLGQPLPAFSLDGNGTVSASRDASEVRVQGSLDARLDQLERLGADVPVAGAFDVATVFDLLRRGDLVRVSRFETRVAREEPLLELTVLQGVEVNTVTGELRVAEPDRDLLRLILQGVPLDLAEPFLGDMSLSGGPVRGEFVASARDGGFGLRAVRPLAINGLAVAQAGEPLLREVDVAMMMNALYTPAGWQAEVASLALRSRQVVLLTAEGKAGQAAAEGAPLLATGRYSANLAALQQQPALTDFAIFERGEAQGDFAASLAANNEFGGTLRLHGMVAVTGDALPEITVEARANQLANGLIEARVPVTVRQDGRNSDLTVHAELRPGDRPRVEATVESERLHVADMQLFLAPLEALPEGADEAEPEAGQPVWGNLEGQLTFTLKEVVYSPTLTVANIHGTIDIGEAALRLRDFEAATADGGAVAMNGTLGYAAEAEQPYQLDAELTVRDFDPGPVFAAIQPDNPPPVEGRFNLDGRFTGGASDLAGLADAVAGDLRLTSRGGTLRALSVDIGNMARTGSTLIDLAGRFGLTGGDSRAARYAERAKAAADLTQKLAAINFDQLSVDLKRTADNDYIIQDLSLIAPTLRLLGSGRIRFQPDVPVWQQPLGLTLQLAAREGLAEDFRKLRLLGDAADTLGYAPLIEKLQLDGSLMSIGTGQLRSLITRAMSAQ